MTRASTLADLGLLLRSVETADQARRLARISGRVVMLMGVIVVAVGALAGRTDSMLEGTLVVLLGLAGGWGLSRVASGVLCLLMALGIATGLAVGAATAGLLIQVGLFGVCLRLAEATWQFRRLRAAC